MLNFCGSVPSWAGRARAAREVLMSLRNSGRHVACSVSVPPPPVGMCSTSGTPHLPRSEVRSQCFYAGKLTRLCTSTVTLDGRCSMQSMPEYREKDDDVSAPTFCRQRACARTDRAERVLPSNRCLGGAKRSANPISTPLSILPFSQNACTFHFYARSSSKL